MEGTPTGKVLVDKLKIKKKTKISMQLLILKEVEIQAYMEI